MIPDHVALPVEQIKQRLQADRDRLWRVVNKCLYGRHWYDWHPETATPLTCRDCGKEKTQ